MLSSVQINKRVYQFTTKVIDGEREREFATKDFLESLCTLLHEAQVWPSTQEQICAELCAAYNYVMVKVNSLLCQYNEVSSTFDSSRTDRVIAATLKRVYNCICNEGTGIGVSGNKSDETISNHMVNIIKVLENPVFHFRSLNLLGRLLLLVTAGCLYKQQNQGYCKDAVSCFVKLTEMAGVPVLKEKCYFHHGLLLASSMPQEGQQERGEEDKGLFIEDVICLFLVTFQQPCHHLVMGHQPWKWLFASMECHKLVEEGRFALALQKLHASVTDCQEPAHKCKLLCLFADCYFHMGCPQLAIQTYRDALHVDSKCFSILYHLSLIYQSLNLPDLELESLNLCVMALADDKKRKKDRIPVMDMDELIWSIHLPTPPVSFLRSKVTFAKRCLQLQRFQEAAEQYSSLIQMLQQDDDVLEFENHENSHQINIAEILVEAAEVLLITRQFQDCIKICNQTQPTLWADDTLAHNTQTLNKSTVDSLSFDNSQSDLFNDINMSQTDNENDIDLSSTPKKNMNMKKNESSIGLHVSFERSRKRLRSGNGEKSESSSDDVDNVENILMTRLLLCKADALILSTGFTDQAVDCLQQAFDILLRSPTSTICQKRRAISDESGVDSPHAKRQRINSDGKASGSQISDTAGTRSSKSHSVWSKLLIDTALRMAKASWERKRFSSVINSCRLVEQLDNDNIEALYLKTQVLSEESCTLKRETIGLWLTKRGVSYLVDKKTLKETIEKLQQAIPQNDKNEVTWWGFSERTFLQFDVKCLECLLNIHIVK